MVDFGYGAFRPGVPKRALEAPRGLRWIDRVPGIRKVGSLFDLNTVWTSGEMRFADGTKYWAVLEVDEGALGEHWNVGVFLSDDKMVFFSTPQFAEKLGKTEKEINPYQYRILGKLRCENIHVTSDGWSPLPGDFTPGDALKFVINGRPSQQIGSAERLIEHGFGGLGREAILKALNPMLSDKQFRKDAARVIGLLEA